MIYMIFDHHNQSIQIKHLIVMFSKVKMLLKSSFEKGKDKYFL